MPAIVGSLFFLVLLAVVVSMVVRVFSGAQALIKANQERAAVEAEMLLEMKELSAKLDALLSAARAPSNQFIPGGKSEN